MSGFCTMHSFSDPEDLAESMVYGVATTSPQSIYMTDLPTIEEKFSQGE
jgi:hypothetical protein